MTPEIVAKMFPNPLPSIDEIEAKYPPRTLPEGAKVMRVAPSFLKENKQSLRLTKMISPL